MNRRKGHWTEMTSVPDFIDMPHRHNPFSVFLDPDTIILHPCLRPAPSDHACCLPTNLPVTWDSLTVLSNYLCLPVSVSACQPR